MTLWRKFYRANANTNICLIHPHLKIAICFGMANHSARALIFKQPLAGIILTIVKVVFKNSDQITCRGRNTLTPLLYLSLLAHKRLHTNCSRNSRNLCTCTIFQRSRNSNIASSVKHLANGRSQVFHHSNYRFTKFPYDRFHRIKYRRQTKRHRRIYRRRRIRHFK